MALPGLPPADTIPASFDTWANDVSSTALDHETRLDTIEGASQDQTPWIENIDAAEYNLDNLGQLNVGSDGSAWTLDSLVGKSIQIGPGRGTGTPQATLVAGEDITEIAIMPVYNFTTVPNGNLIGLDSSPSVSLTNDSEGMGELVGLMGQPTIGGSTDSFSMTQMHGVEALPVIGAANAVVSTVRAVWAKPSAAFGTMTLAYGIDIESDGAFGTIGTMVGVRCLGLNKGNEIWGMQIGDYNSYHIGKIMLGDGGTPVYGLHLNGTAQDRGVIALPVQTTTPTNPSVLVTQVLMYLKASKFVLAVNDGGTIRYKYLDMTGTGVTWVHTTTPP